MGCREYNGPQSGGDGHSGKKRAYFQHRGGANREQHYNDGRGSKRQQQYDLRRGARGLIITSGNPYGGPEAIKEILNLLNAVVDSAEDVPGSSMTKNCAAGSDAPEPLASEQLVSELTALRQEKDRFVPVKDVTRGMSFVRFNSAADSPTRFAYKILHELFSAAVQPAAPLRVNPLLAEGKAAVTESEMVSSVKPQRSLFARKVRSLNRMIPVEICCSPHIDAIRKAAAQVITAYFSNSAVATNPAEFAATPAGGVGAAVSSDKQNGTDLGASTETRPVPTEKELAMTSGQADAVAAPTNVALRLASVSEEADSASVSSSGVTGSTPSEGVDDKGGATAREAAVTGAVDCSVPVFKPAFAVPEGSTWAVRFEKRNDMKSVTRDDITALLGAMVGTKYKVDINNAEFSVIVELNPSFCGLSVVKDYTKFLRYNAHRICHPTPDERAKMQASHQQAREGIGGREGVEGPEDVEDREGSVEGPEDVKGRKGSVEGPEDVKGREGSVEGPGGVGGPGNVGGPGDVGGREGVEGPKA